MGIFDSLFGGSGQTVQQTTTSTPSKDQQNLINLGMPYAQQFASQGGVKLPDTAPIAPFNANQLLGQQMGLTAAGAQQPIVGAAGTGNQFISSGAALDPNTNPGLAGAIQYALAPIQRSYETSTLPGIAREATQTGGYGGSREGIAEGLAAKGEEETVAGTTSNMVMQNYLNALDQMAKGQAVSPAVAQEQTLPATTTSGVGDVQNALQQALMSYGFNKDIYGQENAINVANQLMGLSAGIPGGSSTTTGNVTSQMSPLQAGMGLASIGSSLFGGQNGMFPGALSGLPSSLMSGASSLGSSLMGGLGSIGSSIGSALSSLGPFALLAA